ncbi:hypothetical protein [Actinoallomurus acaciae]|uniref:Uncharacterized protein n=1 Tax=Actinoallomurus acaciae TaxID=502577 RepID=A0ABV5YUN1_9ACTN
MMTKMIGVARQVGDRMLTAFVPRMEAKADACAPYCWCDRDGQGSDLLCEDPCRGDIWGVCHNCC